jgi:hypothetical protein
LFYSKPAEGAACSKALQTSENAEEAEEIEEALADLYNFFMDSLTDDDEPIPRICNPIAHCTDNDGSHTPTAKALGATEKGVEIAKTYMLSRLTVRVQ